MRARLLQRDVGRLRADLLPAVRAHSLVALLAQPAQARGAEGVAAREEQRWLPLLAAHQLEADATPARSGALQGRARQAGGRPGEDPRLHCRAHVATALSSSAEGATARKREGTSSRRTSLTVAAARVRLQVALEQALDAVAHRAVLHRARVLQPHLHLHSLGNLRGHTV